RRRGHRTSTSASASPPTRRDTSTRSACSRTLRPSPPRRHPPLRRPSRRRLQPPLLARPLHRLQLLHRLRLPLLTRPLHLLPRLPSPVTLAGSPGRRAQPTRPVRRPPTARR